MSRVSPPQPQPQSQRLRFYRQPQAWLWAFWKFTRPHTIIGTSLSVWGLFGMAAAIAPGLPSGLAVVRLVGLAWLACLAGNVYIVGLNQLEDIAIDRVNKPHLPLASGEFARQDGRWLVAITGALALIAAAIGGPWLLTTVGISLVIGSAYSLPPIRLKRHPFWASFCILAVRGAVVNLGLFLHYSQGLGLNAGIPAHVWVLTGFVLIFSIAIAIFKDIPDIEGDKRYGIRTLSVALGQRTVFNIARGVLTICYAGVALAAPWLTLVNRPLLVVAHLLVLGLFWWLSLRVEGFKGGASPRQTMSYPAFYQFIWKLFFIEYVMFPLICWLG
ncbi:homogentisate phytyltransferase [filamentous cyanobacterium CCP5]|nr:homogentisate phytyltransferase [filamentous cyanobacterium CCP5]